MQSFLQECKEDPLLWKNLTAEEHGKRIKGFHCCKDSQCSSQTPQEVLEEVAPGYLSCSKVWPFGDRIDPGNHEMALLISGKKKAESPSSSTCTCRSAENKTLSIFGDFRRREGTCLIYTLFVDRKSEANLHVLHVNARHGCRLRIQWLFFKCQKRKRISKISVRIIRFV